MTMTRTAAGFIHSKHWFALFYLICLAFAHIAGSEEPRLTIFPTRVLTLRKGDAFSLLCVLHKTAAMDFSSGIFTWTHFGGMGSEPTIYDINTPNTNRRIAVTTDENDFASFSYLIVFETDIVDSGKITCRYQSDPDPNVDINVEVLVCISNLAPLCGPNVHLPTQLLCTADSVCLDDITLRWIDADSQEVLNATVVPSDSAINSYIETDPIVKHYKCELESRSFPDGYLTCSIGMQDILPTKNQPKHSTTSYPSSTVSSKTTAPVTNQSKCDNEGSNVAGSYVAVSTSVLFALTTVVSAIMNVILGIKYHHKSAMQPRPATVIGKNTSPSANPARGIELHQIDDVSDSKTPYVVMDTPTSATAFNNENYEVPTVPSYQDITSEVDNKVATVRYQNVASNLKPEEANTNSEQPYEMPRAQFQS